MEPQEILTLAMQAAMGGGMTGGTTPGMGIAPMSQAFSNQSTLSYVVGDNLFGLPTPLLEAGVNWVSQGAYNQTLNPQRYGGVPSSIRDKRRAQLSHQALRQGIHASIGDADGSEARANIIAHGMNIGANFIGRDNMDMMLSRSGLDEGLKDYYTLSAADTIADQTYGLAMLSGQGIEYSKSVRGDIKGFMKKASSPAAAAGFVKALAARGYDSTDFAEDGPQGDKLAEQLKTFEDITKRTGKSANKILREYESVLGDFGNDLIKNMSDVENKMLEGAVLGRADQSTMLVHMRDAGSAIQAAGGRVSVTGMAEIAVDTARFERQERGLAADGVSMPNTPAQARNVFLKQQGELMASPAMAGIATTMMMAGIDPKTNLRGEALGAAVISGIRKRGGTIDPTVLKALQSGDMNDPALVGIYEGGQTGISGILSAEEQFRAMNSPGMQRHYQVAGRDLFNMSNNSIDASRRRGASDNVLGVLEQIDGMEDVGARRETTAALMRKASGVSTEADTKLLSGLKGFSDINSAQLMLEALTEGGAIRDYSRNLQGMSMTDTERVEFARAMDTMTGDNFGLVAGAYKKSAYVRSGAMSAAYSAIATGKNTESVTKLRELGLDPEDFDPESQELLRSQMTDKLVRLHAATDKEDASLSDADRADRAAARQEEFKGMSLENLYDKTLGVRDNDSGISTQAIDKVYGSLATAFSGKGWAGLDAKMGSFLDTIEGVFQGLLEALGTEEDTKASGRAKDSDNDADSNATTTTDADVLSSIIPVLQDALAAVTAALTTPAVATPA